MRTLSLFTLIFCIVSQLALGTLSLRGSFQEAEAGDYLVTTQDQLYTLMHIFEKGENSLIIEEITIPKSTFKKGNLSWKEWLKNDAPNNHSWVIYEVELEKGQFQEYYSFSRGGWLKIPSEQGFLPTLLNMEFTLVPETERRRIGGGKDPSLQTNPVWYPPITVEGNKYKRVKFDVWTAHWPKDGSELADRRLEIYLPEVSDAYPTYFPYWIQVSDALGRAHLRVVDAGREMTSPRHALPRRPPEFIGGAKLKEGMLQLRLKVQPYYRDFVLFAADTSLLSRTMVSLPSTVVDGEEGEVLLEVRAEHLEKYLTPGHEYIFMAVPKGFSETFAETKQPFLWRS